MATVFSTGISQDENSFYAGKLAAQMAFERRNHQNTDLIILFAGINHDLEEVKRGIFSVIDVRPLIGCSSAGEFNENEITKGGVVCALISSDTHRFFNGIGSHVTYDEIEAVKSAVKDFPKHDACYPYCSAMIFLDGLIGKGEEVVLASQSILGPDVKFAGAAAADNFQLKETVVFCDGQILSNAVSICLLRSQIPIVITIKHGHQPISPPLIVTKAKGNVLYEIAGESAFSIWKKYVREDLKKEGIDIDSIKDPEELSQWLVKYEAGFMTGNDYKVRFPSSVNNDGSINFSCSIFEGSALKIMSSNAQDQICSAKRAALQALEIMKNKKIAGVIVFDCACRESILKEKFPQAVDGIRGVFKDIPMIGLETYGEIAMEIGQLSGFHNTTTVIMLIPD